jgi:putative transposase
MKKCQNTLEKSIEHILYFENENAIDLITKTVFESILKAERVEFLANNNSKKNKANGYYSKLAKAINKYFKLSVPRDRLGLFKPVFLDCIKKQDQRLMDLSFKLYTKGLTTREVSEILEEFYDKKISASWVSNITKSFQDERESWQNKKLEKNYYFVYIDALNIAVRRDSVTKEAFYVVLGVKEDLTREILGVYNIPMETIEGWRKVFEDLKNRGFEKTLMIIADGLAELETIIAEEFRVQNFKNA